MALNRAVEINHGRGLSGTPLVGHTLSAAAKASCIASSARSKSPSKRIRVARIRRESTRYRESSNSRIWSRICSGERSDMTTTLTNQLSRINLANGGSIGMWLANMPACWAEGIGVEKPAADLVERPFETESMHGILHP